MRTTSIVRSKSFLWPVGGIAIAAFWLLGCGSSAKVPPPAASSPTATTPAATTPSASNPSAISPELIQKVNDLVRLNKEYSALAGTIQTFDEFKKNADTLSGIEQQLSSLVEDVMIAEAKLPASQKTEFTSKYYDALAKPVVEEQRRQKARVVALIP